MTVYLSLGANLGNREETLECVLQILSAEVGTLLRRSAYYYSAPMGFESEHEFCNICAAYSTTLDPIELLHRTQAIEQRLGRTSKSLHGIYHDRPIDIDLILYYDERQQPVAVHHSELTLPHPRYRERDFVMIPLREILPTA